MSGQDGAEDEGGAEKRPAASRGVAEELNGLDEEEGGWGNEGNSGFEDMLDAELSKNEALNSAGIEATRAAHDDAPTLEAPMQNQNMMVLDTGLDDSHDAYDNDFFGSSSRKQTSQQVESPASVYHMPSPPLSHLSLTHKHTTLSPSLSPSLPPSISSLIPTPLLVVQTNPAVPDCSRRWEKFPSTRPRPAKTKAKCLEACWAVPRG
jgi:hypothetical protein